MTKVKLILISLLTGISYFHFAQAQVTTTANDVVPEVNDFFRYGVVPSFYPSWGTQDTALANISAGNPNVGVEGAGVKAWRATLPEWFINQFGNNVRTFAFEHYETIGMTNHTVFLEGPQADHIDQTQYCAGTPSIIFDNLYLDIWDNGQNGTPVNDDNYYALYMYNVATTYSPYVKFWEIWNEPDFSGSPNAFNPPGTAGSWWDNDPDPCDLKIKAPIYHYIRMLRISYEVIKSIDPDAFITTGGIGFPSFLDAIMRNTDNPNNGDPSTEYPLTGGAYFDAVSFHQYPHIDGCFRIGWNNQTQMFDYKRHSDAAADCLVERKGDYQSVLASYGYDGSVYPQKEYIITESNLPRKGISFGGDNFGNDEIQRNWIIKACVRAQQNDISQFHVFKIGEDQDFETASFEFQLMGLYKNLNASAPYTQEYTDEGIAYRTMSEELFGYSYDQGRTSGMNLPDNVEGAAFRSPDGSYKYVVWARTETDTSEDAEATYNFPQNWSINMMSKKSWSSSVDGSEESVSSINISLTGAPSFLEPTSFFGANNFDVAIQVTDASCAGARDGRLVAMPSGGVPEYRFAWSTLPGSFSASNTLSNLPAGTYQVTVLDANLASTTATAIIEEPAPLTIDLETQTLTCETTEINVFFIDSNQSIFIEAHDTPGMYTSLLERPGECDVTLRYTILEDIEEPLAIISGNTTTTEIPCFGFEFSGFIDGSQSSFGPDFTYLWTTIDGLILSGETTNTCEYGAGGTYELLVTDLSNGCFSSVSTFIVDIIPPDELEFVSADIQNTQTGQATGSITPVIIGGTPPYEYLWSNGAQTLSIENLPAGTYSLTVTDANGCEILQTFEVLNGTTSTGDINEKSTLSLFPNPTSGQLQIEANQRIDNLILYDLAGQEIWKYEGVSDSQIKLDFNFLAAGCYLLEYEMDGNRGIERVIVF